MTTCYCDKCKKEVKRAFKVILEGHVDPVDNTVRCTMAENVVIPEKPLEYCLSCYEDLVKLIHCFTEHKLAKFTTE